MAELKTKPNDQSVQDFLNGIENEQKRKDSFAILEMMKAVTKAEPKMWGASIIGFGSYRYKYASGREGDWFLAGFSPRKQNLTIYMMSCFAKQEELLAKLGKYKTGKSCLYIKKLADIDENVLKEMIIHSIETMSKRYQ